MRITRREFVRAGAGSVVAASTFGPSRDARVAAAESSADTSGPSFPIVDTHQHLWDLSKQTLPWLKPGGELYRSYVTKDYLAATKGLGVIKAVYMEVAVAPKDKLAEAERVIEICRDPKTPTVAAVIGGQPADEQFPAYIGRFKDSPYIKGVRQILPSAKSEQELYAEATFAKGVQLLGELGMRFDLCMPPDRLPDAVKLVDACPDTRFVLDHCGNADPKWYRDWPGESAAESAARRRAREAWQRGIAELARRENVIGKISGIIARVPKDDWSADDLAPIINHCLEVFGPDRVVFASDWPVCTRGASLKQWVAALREVVRSRPESEQKRLFCDNAIRFYGLD